MALFKSRGLRIAVLASIVVMVGLISMRSLTVNAQPDPCSPCDNEMAIDSLWGNATEEASATHAIDPAGFEWSVRIRNVTNDYQAYGALVEYDGDIIQFMPILPKNATYLGLGGMTSNATALDSAAVFPLRTLEMGSNNPDAAQMDEGEAVKAKFKCLKAGTTALRLVPPAGGVGNSTTLDPGGAVIPTGLTAGQIVCKNLSDVVTEKTDSEDPVAAGAEFDYVITSHNDGPNPVKYWSMGDNLPEVVPDDPGPDGIPGTADDSPAVKEFVSWAFTLNGNPAPVCAFYPVFPHPITLEYLLNVVMCDVSAAVGGAGLPVSSTAVLTITVKAPLWDAGKLNFNAGQGGSLDQTSSVDDSNEDDCPLILDPANLGCEFTQVLPATLTIVKEADGTAYAVGDTIEWTITATCSATGSPCADATGVTGPPITEDPQDANQDIQNLGASLDVAGTCTPADPAAGAAVTCTPTLPIAPGTSVVMTVLADVVDYVDKECVNLASATGNTDQDGDSTAETFSDSETVRCLSARTPAVGMIKGLDPAGVTQEDIGVIAEDGMPSTNLWLCEGPWPACAANGAGHLDIYEHVINVADDDEGVGAYEFQLKFNHKIFDIEIEDASWLSNGGTRTVNCASTIVTENWILFGCVSSDAAGPPPAPGIGNQSDGVLAIIHVTPEIDLKYRMTPGNNNGLVSPLLDENCELADVLGHPLAKDDGTPPNTGDDDGDTVVDEDPVDGVDNDLDNKVDEDPPASIVQGGLVADPLCSDMAITVRILEGDLNLDCEVSVEDQQMIAYRYGAFFGTLFYDPWFDLEPWVKDFDIDIKDLQKVFGRNGSTCDNPIPAQDPVPPPQ